MDLNFTILLIFTILISLFAFFQCLKHRKIVREFLKTKEKLKDSEKILKTKVKTRTKELEELAQRLKEESDKKTKELQGKVEELERFNRLATGRETKMIELKEEIKRLKKLKIYGKESNPSKRT